MAYINGKEVLFSGRFGGTNTPAATLPITENGTYDVTDFAKVEVEVEAKDNTNTPTANIMSTVKTITQNGTYYASSDGYDGYSMVKVNIAKPTAKLIIDAAYLAANNGKTIDISSYGKLEIKIDTFDDDMAA